MGIRSVPLRTQYRTGESDLVEDFYIPCLTNASIYDRAVGYFRSSVYLMVGASTVEFAKRGGRIRLVCSPSLTPEDATSIQVGYKEREQAVKHALLLEIDQLLADGQTEYRTRVLATLVATGSLDIRIAIRPEGTGIFHDKIGVFSDSEGDSVSFLGSANETWSGWSDKGNHEAIEVFCSWHDDPENARVLRHREYFERLWKGLAPGVEVVDFPEEARLKLDRASLGDVDRVDLNILRRVDNGRKPMRHQIEAIAAWNARGGRGIFEHATGSGKTFLALTAIKPHLDRGLPALIFVPSALLLKQWHMETVEVFPKATIMLAGAGNTRWAKGSRLSSMTSASTNLGQRIVLSTMQTGASEAFRSSLCDGSHLLVVADEVHQIGSLYNSQALEIESGSRLGLSATPSRYGDAEGTAKILNYFGDIIPPPFTLQDAILAGRLVPYEYFPHAVNLTADESSEWAAVTKRIGLEVVKSERDDSGGRALSEKTKMLLIERSRIAKKAANKVHLAVDVLAKNYLEGQRWLVYCEDTAQMKEVQRAFRDAGIACTEYHTAMTGDPEETLRWFKVAGGVLVSIKCLDEGVDIPSADHALILSSSQNPRQFIQRRGRVLRKSEGKYLARIHDALVMPVCLDEEPDQMSLLKSEFLRAVEFARSAMNRTAVADLRSVATRLGIDPDELINDGYEEDL